MDTIISGRPNNFCAACSVRNRAICADLDDEEIRLLNTIGRQRTLAVGEALLWEGDDAVLVANVIDGVLKLSTQTAEGKEQILGLAYASDFLGRPFGQNTPYDVEALTPVQVCVFQRADFDRFARDHPRLEHRLLERTLTELDRTRRWMMLLGRMNAEQKLASFLIETTERIAPEAGDAAPGAGPVTIALPLSRQQIADVLGLTIETVSRQFTRMKNEGLIAIPSRREIAILDREALAIRAG
ncbi:Crp/Fnr family transcriptional regulator [Croceicoccus sp. YJ47]|uniref:Crp/Fnr family transcriptional regulator n=1 Tax=Croceicoccus sp. YJ47 TaxID=2798724 RepID=UPI001920DB50|nr:Crp/Fnr family transcriptional regulator [Croceicoccus sp. YJ47]QQN73136.1 Crp/Fnr family transcriptional regulator [Croceicoccus sp. YJ47]